MDCKWCYTRMFRVLRSRSSYNAGVWHDYYTTTPENQTQFIVPTNEHTQTIDYNMRF